MVRMPLTHVVESSVVVLCCVEEIPKRSNDVFNEAHKSGEGSAFQLHGDVSNTKRLISNVLTHNDAAYFPVASGGERLQQSCRNFSWEQHSHVCFASRARRNAMLSR